MTIITIEALIIHLHCPETHPHAGKSAIVKQVLHGDFLREIGEKCDTIIGTFFGCGITQRGHAFGKIHQAVDAFNTASGGGECR